MPSLVGVMKHGHQCWVKLGPYVGKEMHKPLTLGRSHLARVRIGLLLPVEASRVNVRANGAAVSWRWLPLPSIPHCRA